MIIYVLTVKSDIVLRILITLWMSLVIGFGPLDENETTNDAYLSFFAILFSMVAVGLLQKIIAYTHKQCHKFRTHTLKKCLENIGFYRLFQNFHNWRRFRQRLTNGKCLGVDCSWDLKIRTTMDKLFGQRLFCLDEKSQQSIETRYMYVPSFIDVERNCSAIS